MAIFTTSNVKFSSFSEWSIFFVARAHIGERVCGEVSSIAAVLRDRMQVLWKWGLKTEKLCELEVVFLS